MVGPEGTEVIRLHAHRGATGARRRGLLNTIVEEACHEAKGIS